MFSSEVCWSRDPDPEILLITGILEEIHAAGTKLDVCQLCPLLCYALMAGIMACLDQDWTQKSNKVLCATGAIALNEFHKSFSFLVLLFCGSCNYFGNAYYLLIKVLRRMKT